MPMNSGLPPIYGVEIVRATNNEPAWHVEWWQGNTGPFIVVGCTKATAQALVQQIQARKRQGVSLVGAYEIGRQWETMQRGWEKES